MKNRTHEKRARIPDEMAGTPKRPCEVGREVNGATNKEREESIRRRKSRWNALQLTISGIGTLKRSGSP